MADNTFAFVIIFIWLILITGLIIAVGLGVYFHKIDGLTGPTGPSQGPIGPIGPTGPTGPPRTTTTLSTPVMTTFTTPLTTMGCFPCQFETNGQILDYQIIPAGKPPTGGPSSIRWVVNSNIPYDNGTFILPVGTYVVSNSETTSVVYPSTLSNNGGTYRRAAIWLRDHSNNLVSENELINITNSFSIPNTPTILNFAPTRFTVTSTRNQMSIITWHDAMHSLEIGALSRFYLQKIN